LQTQVESLKRQAECAGQQLLTTVELGKKVAFVKEASASAHVQLSSLPVAEALPSGHAAQARSSTGPQSVEA